MKLENGIKRLSKYGAIENVGGKYWIIVNGYEVSFLINGTSGNVVCFHTQRVSEKTDSNADYFPGSYWKNLSQALRFVEKRGEER